MRLMKLALSIVLILGITSISACNRARNKAAIEEMKKAQDEDMKKAIELNKGQSPPQ